MLNVSTTYEPFCLLFILFFFVSSLDIRLPDICETISKSSGPPIFINHQYISGSMENPTNCYIYWLKKNHITDLVKIMGKIRVHRPYLKAMGHLV